MGSEMCIRDRGSAARRSGQDFLWYLWCGKLSPLFGRSAMTTFERLYVEDKSTHTEKKDPYYTWYNEEAVCRRILAEFGLPGTSHIVNGHVPVQEKNGESPITVSYTHLRAHETDSYLVCRLLLEKKKR